MNDSKKPNFFIVGMPKTGTTSLFEVMNGHPDIFLPERKEPSFFCNEYIHEKFKDNKTLHDLFYLDEKSYLDFYSAVEDQKVIGDISPSTAVSVTAPKRIREFNPDAKIVLIFREPVSFLYSLHSEKFANREEREEGFLKALELEENRRKNHKNSFLFYSDWVDYAAIVSRYLDVFSKEQVKVMFFDDFRADSAAFYADLLSFLDLVPQEGAKFENRNKSKKLVFPALRDLIEYITRTLNLSKIMKLSFVRSLAALYFRLFLVSAERKPLSPELTKKLKEKHRENVASLEKILIEKGLVPEEKDLKELWGY